MSKIDKIIEEMKIKLSAPKTKEQEEYEKQYEESLVQYLRDNLILKNK